MRHAVSIQPVSADIGDALNEFGKGARFHDIAVRAGGMAAREVVLVIRSGKDDDGDSRKPCIGPELFQQITTVLAPEV